MGYFLCLYSDLCRIAYICIACVCMCMCRTKVTSNEIYIKTFICGLYNKHKFGVEHEIQVIVLNDSVEEKFCIFRWSGRGIFPDSALIRNIVREWARYIDQSLFLALKGQFPFWTIEIYG